MKKITVLLIITIICTQLFAAVSVSADDVIRIEGEDYATMSPSAATDFSLSSNAAYSGGTALDYHPSVSTSVLTYEFDVTAGGKYNLEAVLSTASEWHSLFTLELNGTTVVQNTAEPVNVGPAVGSEMSHLQFTEVFTLNSGVNILTITLPVQRTGGGGGYTFFADYFEFTPAAARSVIKFEGENYTSKNVPSILPEGSIEAVWGGGEAGVSGGGYLYSQVVDSLPGGEKYYYSYDVDVDIAGEYIMTAGHLPYMYMPEWVSPFHIELNGKTLVAVSESEPVMGDLIHYDTYQMAYSTRPILEAGKNTFKFVIDEKATNGSRYIFTLDYVSLKKTPDIASVDAELSGGNGLALGSTDSVAVSVTSSIGALLDEADYTCTYSSSDDSIISVDANGAVTANNPGSAVITVNASSYGTTGSASFKVTAVVDGLVTESLARAGGNVTASVRNTTPSAKNVTLFVNTYTVSNGVERLTGCVFEKKSVAAGALGNFSVTLPSGTDTVQVYLWTDTGDITPLYSVN